MTHNSSLAQTKLPNIYGILKKTGKHHLLFLLPASLYLKNELVKEED